MDSGVFRKKYQLACSLLLFCATAVLAQYTYSEGTDTTDAQGKGLNGLFTFTANRSNQISGAALVYGNRGYGYLNCSFDEICKVPDTIYEQGADKYLQTFSQCFVVNSPIDSTWAKVQLIKKLSDNRYVYRFGKNTTPGNRFLIRPDYDQQRCYRPNNTRWSEVYSEQVNGMWRIVQRVTLYWEPPVKSVRNVIGYVIYASEKNIDTSKPVNLKDWMVLGSVQSTTTSFNPQAGWRYLNVVAVYPGDTSEFSSVFTEMNYPIHTIRSNPAIENRASPVSLNRPEGLILAPFLLYTMSGRLLLVRRYSGKMEYANAPAMYVYPSITNGNRTCRVMAGR